MKPLTVEDSKQLMSPAQGDRLEALYIWALTTGMRPERVSRELTPRIRKQMLNYRGWPWGSPWGSPYRSSWWKRREANR